MLKIGDKVRYMNLFEDIGVDSEVTGIIMSFDNNDHASIFVEAIPNTYSLPISNMQVIPIEDRGINYV